ncbi:MAG: hypothetical protein RIQ53_3125 [Pseudomonadota bacterium]
MFRRRLTVTLISFASVLLLTAVLAVATLAVTERQVVRGRVAGDIATGYVQLSAQKQRLRTWVAQLQQGLQPDPGVRTELQAALAGTVQRLKGLVGQARALDDSEAAGAEHQRRSETLQQLQTGLVALLQAVDQVRPLGDDPHPAQAWQALAQMFDMPQGLDIRMLIAENIAIEAASVQRERAAADATLAGVRWLWLAAALLLASAALAVAWHFDRALRDPLQQLNEGAQALQAGRLGHRIAYRGEDEFGAVARSVNALAAELEQHRERESADRQRLEDLVAVRTRELADALASLRQADGQRRRLFADISHELRTPTTVIRGEAEITLRGTDKPPAEYREALRRIAETARQLGTVIDDLLAMARSDIDALSLTRETVDLDELAAQALEPAAALASRRGVQLELPPPRSGAHLVAGDPQRLRQLLLVLLDNATRYSHAGGRVELRLWRAAAPGPGPGHAADGVCLAVRDHGIGIDPVELPQVFERHFRGARARRHSPDGSGLGLSIARVLAQAHGGRLQLEPAVGGGTQATLWLPLQPATDELLAEAAGPPPQGLPAPVHRPSTPPPA